MFECPCKRLAMPACKQDLFALQSPCFFVGSSPYRDNCPQHGSHFPLLRYGAWGGENGWYSWQHRSCCYRQINNWDERKLPGRRLHSLLSLFEYRQRLSTSDNQQNG